MQVLEVDLDRDRISLSLKATQQDPWQEFASNHRVGELVYGRVTKLVPFGAFVQVGDGIEGLVHISEMSAHHVDLPEQVVTPAEELWVKIIDLDLQRRRISLSIKQAAEGGRRRRRVPGGVRRPHVRRPGQLHRPVVRGGQYAEGQEAWEEFYNEDGTPLEGTVVEGASTSKASSPSKGRHARGRRCRGRRGRGWSRAASSGPAPSPRASPPKRRDPPAVATAAARSHVRNETAPGSLGSPALRPYPGPADPGSDHRVAGGCGCSGARA